MTVPPAARRELGDAEVDNLNAAHVVHHSLSTVLVENGWHVQSWSGSEGSMQVDE